MPSIEITCVVDNKAKLGEGPVWDVQDQVLWWTDIKGKCIHRFDPVTGTNTNYPLPVHVGCFALRETSGFLLAAEHGFYTWDPETGDLDHFLDVEADRTDNRMNDGGCDRQGRLLASSMSLSDPRQSTGASGHTQRICRGEIEPTDGRPPLRSNRMRCEHEARQSKRQC